MMFTDIKILNNFSSYLLIVKGYSETTVKDYCMDLKLFFEFIVSYLDWNINLIDINIFFLAQIEENDLFAYLSYLNSYRKNGSNTKKRKVASIKAFFKWIYSKYNSTLTSHCNPALSLTYIEKTKILPKYLTINDALIIQQIFNEKNSRYYVRDNTIIVMFLNCGMRLSELANLNIKDINFELKELRLIGKGNKERTIYLNQKVLKQLQLYLSTREDNYEALFLSSRKTKLRPRTIEYICNKAFNLASLSSYGYTTHTLRHTAATHIYAKTNDILVVKEFLGHDSISATEIYTHISNKELKEAVEKNPLSNYNYINIY